MQHQAAVSYVTAIQAKYLDVAQDLLPQHLAKAKVLDTYRVKAQKYGAWSSDERRDYLQPLLGVVNNFSRYADLVLHADTSTQVVCVHNYMLLSCCDRDKC